MLQSGFNHILINVVVYVIITNSLMNYSLDTRQKNTCFDPNF